jgi:hypothetical protein
MHTMIRYVQHVFSERARRVAATWGRGDRVFDSGLQTKQSPPITVPFRFFLTAPLFLLMMAFVMLWCGPEIMLYRLSPAALAATHLFTLGFMAMVMLGALLQLLPVVADAHLAKPRLIAAFTHAAVTIGTLSLCGGFLFEQPRFVRMGAVVLVAGFVVFILAVATALLRSPLRNALVWSVQFAVAALALTVTFGTMLAASHAWNVALPNLALPYLHPAWGLLGWAALLAIGVAFRVVPMFQLTPRYPTWLTRYLPATVFALLVLWSISLWASDEMPTLVARLSGLGLAGVLGIFAVATLVLQYRRKSEQSDVTVYFWALGMTSLLISVLATVLRVSLFVSSEQSDRINIFIGITVLVGFFGSIITGMLYKIVPFLTWFRLHAAAGANRRLPNVKTIIPERRQRLQFIIHFAALSLLTGAALWSPLVYPAAVALACSAIALEANCIRATVTLLRRT